MFRILQNDWKDHNGSEREMSIAFYRRESKKNFTTEIGNHRGGEAPHPIKMGSARASLASVVAYLSGEFFF
jgi:hypothetical protein